MTETGSQMRAGPLSGASGRFHPLRLAAFAVALLVLLPLGAVVASLVQTPAEGVSALTAVLPRYIGNSLILALGVSVGASLFGISTAWLVTMCRFPGRRLLSWALILPLAAPAYVLAYAYTDFLSHPGPVQSGLRALFGWGPRDYWFPQIRSLPGAIFIFSAVLYPYVYLFARSAFLEQSAALLQAGRSLGASPWTAFRRIALPLARPAIVGGVALALMETLADFGTVAHFGVQTFTTGIYRAWLDLGDQVLAGQLAAALLGLIALLLLAERLSRGQARYHQTAKRYQPLAAYQLRGGRAALALIACLVPLAAGFLLPLGILVQLAATYGHNVLSARYLALASNTFLLASAAGVLAAGAALAVVYAARLIGGPGPKGALRAASLGYAVPGSILAVGLLVPLGALDGIIDSASRSAFGVSTGPLLSGSLFALIYAYVVRFLAAAAGPVEASAGKLPLSLDAAGRTLGRGRLGVLREIHLPLIRGGLLTGALIVFVETAKELPATLIMRPFNFDTLAVQTYRLASDERLAEASSAALIILVVGLLPVILLSRAIMAGRDLDPGPGGQGRPL